MTLLGSEHSVLIRSKFKSVLQLRLQQRRTREQLADQGIMPPLKSPAAFHEQRKSLERSKTGDYLKHKIRSRPEKAELVNMRILQESAGEGLAHESQTKLKRARLADDLNEKIALRPGPLELVEKNIIPVHSTVKEAAIKVSHGKLPEDSYAFEEDSGSESLSPESENKSSGSISPTIQGPQSKDDGTQNHEESMTDGQGTIPVPAIVKAKVSEKNRHKKPKDIKPKVKKLKYHQYIPPDQKPDRAPPPQMDSAYARLLQQQQLFLQLQILSQQKHTHTHTPPQSSFSYQTLSQHSTPSAEPQASCASAANSSSSSSPVKSSYCSPSSISPARAVPLPANLDDLKVSELRQQLRIRGLPVSGTKTALIDRLRPFRDSSCASPSGSADITSAPYPVTPTGSLSSYQSGPGFFCSGSTPPISPASSDLSLSSFSDVPMSSPQFGLEAEKDKMLVEKQKVIEELTWKLQQEQRQVEELRLQLHKRKRDGPAPHAMHLQPQFYGVSVKQEHMASSCPLSAFLSPQCSPEDSPVPKPSISPQPSSPIQPYLLRDGCSHRPTRNIQLQQKSVCPSASCSYPSEHRSLQPLYSSPSESSLNPRASSKPKSAGMQQKEALSLSPRHLEPKSPTSSSVFCSSDCRVSKRPPCYEDAVKQQMVRSQQMDELLDVLIESGVSPKFPRHYSHMSAYEPGDVHLEALLSRTQADAALLKMSSEDEAAQSFGDKLMMDTPVSPTAGKMAAESQGLGMTFPESPWESMEWLDLTPPSSATAFPNGLPPAGPSIFNTEFLDVTDISLNSAMDLHLDHW
ncbi:myocardin isoform X3 [Pseudorasbora parva]|uniref:myocardin isoform X3 n=1 Tax=Pseudorasbora parva TaxID=51549 RepID=UPI00351DF293